MTKAKYLILLLIVITLILIIPNIANAAEYTYSDTEQGIEWSYQLDSSENVVNLRCKTTSVIGAVTIPSTIDGKTVISLAGSYFTGAFKDCAGLTEITIPDTITIIGDYAFDNCTGLKAVTIPNSVTEIGDYSFESCTGLKTLTIPNSVTKIGARAFSGCTGITSVTLSENLTSIGDYAFSRCTGLKSIIIPDSVTIIDNGAFANCSGLKEVKLSKHLTKISDCSFEGCSGLTSVIIPDSVTTIEGSDSYLYGGFGDCENLEKVLIPDTVASIGIGAFRGCDKLTIYGHDGQVSKQFAEEHNINFDYIENWDKQSGSDISAPTVDNMWLKYSSVSAYWNSTTNDYRIPVGAKIVIEVKFNEDIKGTSPTLTLKIGNGSEKGLSNGVISGKYIVYEYTTVKEDSGLISVTKFEGGAITDNSGNKAVLSTKKLTVEIVGNYAYVDNTKYSDSSQDNQNTNNSGNPSDSQNSNGSNNSDNPNNSGNSNNSENSGSSGNTSNQSNKNNGDSTTATGKLPQTGESIVIIASIIVILAITATIYLKIRKLRDI